MKRCIQSADILFPDVERIEIPQWREIDFGLFEYKNYAQLNGNPEYQAWIDSGGRIPYPGGESRDEFLVHCVQGLEYAAGLIRQIRTEHNCEYGEFSGMFSAAAVVHGGTGSFADI